MRNVDHKTGYNLRNLIPGRIDSRTYIKVNNGYMSVYLHNSPIASWNGETLIIDTCGYKTLITLNRINGILNEFSAGRVKIKAGKLLFNNEPWNGIAKRIYPFKGKNVATKDNILEVCNELEQYINKSNKCSAWSKGVCTYALDFIDFLREEKPEFSSAEELEGILLNGADTWDKFSHDGSALVFDEDIAGRLCTKSELLLSDNGRRAPNKNEQWLDVQARALFQACLRLKEAFELIKNKK